MKNINPRSERQFVRGASLITASLVRALVAT